MLWLTLARAAWELCPALVSKVSWECCLLLASPAQKIARAIIYLYFRPDFLLHQLGSLGDDDRRLCTSIEDPELAHEILSIKHNDPEVKRLQLGWVDVFDSFGWRRPDVPSRIFIIVIILLWMDCVVASNNHCTQILELIFKRRWSVEHLDSIFETIPPFERFCHTEIILDIQVSTFYQLPCWTAQKTFSWETRHEWHEELDLSKFHFNGSNLDETGNWE